jgi:hypothetical protein
MATNLLSTHRIKMLSRLKKAKIVSGVDNGIQKGDLSEAKARKCPVDTFLARGRIPVQLTASQRDVGSCAP